MTASPTRRPGRPARLQPDQVMRAAVELADESGIEAVTMRTVAHRVGAEAMSLYRHVANKEALLDGMIDLVYSEIELPAADAEWISAIRARAISARAALMRHPWAIALMESRTSPGSAHLRHHEANLAVLLGAGFTSAQAVRAFNIVDSYLYGFALQERVLPVVSPEDFAAMGPEILDAIPADEFPNLARTGRELMEAGFDYRAEFEAGLDLILGALATAPKGANT